MQSVMGWKLQQRRPMSNLPTAFHLGVAIPFSSASFSVLGGGAVMVSS